MKLKQERRLEIEITTIQKEKIDMCVIQVEEAK